MSQRPLISVVVPFFNNESTIRTCIESLLAQSDVGGPFEVIVVDNRSTDASLSIAEEYPGLMLLREQTPGAYAARNTGIRAAAAPLIAFTDADCAVDSGWLFSIAGGMRQPRNAVLVGHCRYPREASLTLRLLGAYENAKAEYVIDRCQSAHHFAYCNNMAVRASVFDEIGPFEEWQRAADTEIVHRLAARRPDLRLAFRRSMRVTHMEFIRGRRRAKRLRLYSGTNARIGTFRELGVGQRLGVLLRLARSRSSE